MMMNEMNQYMKLKMLRVMTDRDSKGIRWPLVWLGFALEDRPRALLALPKRPTHMTKEYLSFGLSVDAVRHQPRRPLLRSAQGSHCVCGGLKNWWKRAVEARGRG